MRNRPAVIDRLAHQLRRSPDPTNKVSEDGMRIAAVLVVLFPRIDDVSLLLTRRPDSLRSHAGQISLPGGAREPDDHDLWQTALRETREELGIDTSGLQLLGQLDAIPVIASGYLIRPFVAWSRHVPEIKPDPVEVSGVIEVALKSLLDPASIAEEVWELHGQEWLVTFFRVEGVVVWGATARILSLLCCSLGTHFPERDRTPGSVQPLLGFKMDSR